MLQMPDDGFTCSFVCLKVLYCRSQGKLDVGSSPEPNSSLDLGIMMRLSCGSACEVLLSTFMRLTKWVPWRVQVYGTDSSR